MEQWVTEPTGVDQEQLHQEVPATVVQEVAPEVTVPIGVQAPEATNPIEVHLLERAVIAPREAEVPAIGAVEAIAPEAVPEAPGEAIEAPADRIGLQAEVGHREAVDLQAEAVEVEEIKPIESSRT